MRLRKRFLGYTILGWTNLLILQWFFVRLQATMDEDYNVIGWKIIGLIVPGSGWWTQYVWVKRVWW